MCIPICRRLCRYQSVLREVEIIVAGIAIVDTTDLAKLKRGDVIAKTNKSGIKTSYQIKDNRLISTIDVPEKKQKVIVKDINKTITIEDNVVKEKKKPFWERFQGNISFLFFSLLLVVIVLYLIKRFVK